MTPLPSPLCEADRTLLASYHRFLPSEVFDIHAHLYDPDHFGPGAWAAFQPLGRLGCAEHRAYLRRSMPGCATVHGLYFGLPERTGERVAINAEVAWEVASGGSPLSRALLLASPEDAPDTVATALRGGRYVGLKVYHCYAPRPDTQHARVEEYAPGWMWELLEETRGILMLHLVCDGALADADNQRDLRHLCRRYPNVRLILAHVARSFNYRTVRKGLASIADLDNAFIDTSAICEAETFRTALRMLGPRRILWGSDFPVSELRGRCVTMGQAFYWLHPETTAAPPSARASHFPLVGMESLVTLCEAAEDCGLTEGDMADLFLHNALRTLAPHLPESAVPTEPSGPELWSAARAVISGGTGLLSKRAEMFDPRAWPTCFSRARGCDVWDMAGRRYADFAGGIGAVFLGYGDEAVDAAVRRRILLGNYASLVNPQERVLAERLLALHPWAGKVRYARGGGEAMAVAVRIARAATGRSGVVFCGYHGWHDWYLAANLGDCTALDGHLLPGLNPKGVPRELAGTSTPFVYNDLASLKAAIARHEGNLAAVVMEPMRSQWPHGRFLEQAAALCRAAGAVWVVDEITAGLRFGTPGALARLGAEPDLAVYAKAFGNGYPFGAVVGREAVMAGADESFISSSYWTDGIGTAAALAVLEQVEKTGASQVVWKQGERMQRAMREIAARHPACAFTVGGMPASPSTTFALGADAPLAKALYPRKMAARGYLVGGVCYLMLAHGEGVISRFLEVLDEVLGELAEAISHGRLEAEAGVPRQEAGFVRLA